MKASVQYDDYCGTAAADRCDLFEEYPAEMTKNIVERFDIPVDPVNHKFIGVSVSGTQVDDVCAYFYFKNRANAKYSEILHDKCFNAVNS